MRISAAFLLLLTLPSAYAQPHPDFTGTWQQNNSRCDPRPKNNSYSYKAVIHQQGNLLNLDVTVSGTTRQNGELHLVYEIGGKETIYTGLDHDEFHTTAHWEDDKLIFNTIEHESGHINKTTEIWTLEDNGRALQRVKQEKETGDYRRTFILDKLK